MKNLLANALAWFNRLGPLSKLAVVVVALLGLAALSSPGREETAYEPYGPPEQPLVVRLATSLTMLSIPVMLLGALAAAYDFRSAKKQHEARLTGAPEHRPLAYKPVPYRLAALVATGAFLLYEIVAFSQYEHTYIDSQRPLMWSLFGDYLARRVIILGIAASSVAIVLTLAKRVLRTSRSTQPV